MSDLRKHEGESHQRWPMIWPEDAERILDRALRGVGMMPRRHSWRLPSFLREGKWAPDVDVFERDGKLVVRADLPGVKPEDIDLEVDGGALIIHGHRKEEKEVKEEDYYFCERLSGEFSRSVSLPEGVRAEEMEATYHDGVLEVMVPLPAPAESKKTKIAIK